jgi:hypothetical protein
MWWNGKEDTKRKWKRRTVKSNNLMLTVSDSAMRRLRCGRACVRACMRVCCDVHHNRINMSWCNIPNCRYQ